MVVVAAVVVVVVVVVVVLSVCLCAPFMFYLFCSYHFVLLLCCWGFPVSFAMCSFVCVSLGSVHNDANLLFGTFVK